MKTVWSRLLERIAQALIVSIFVLSSPLRAFAEPITIKISLISYEKSPKGQACMKFKELVENYSGGELRVEVHTNSELFKDREEVEALQHNAIQIIVPAISKFATLGVAEFDVFDIPYLFENLDRAHGIIDGPLGQRLLSRLEPKGLKGLAYWDLGFKQFHANRPLHKLSDFKGLKIRAQKSEVIEAQMKALGAEPAVLSVTKYIEAFRANRIEASESPIVNYAIADLPKFQKYLTLSNHGYHGYGVVMNKKFWDELSSPHQSIVERAMKEATRYERQLAVKETEASLAKLKTDGRAVIYELPAKDLAEIRAALLPVRKQFEKVHGTDLTSQIGEAVR